MATLLRSDYSARRMLKICKRHFRLAKQVYNDSDFSDTLQPLYTNLEAKAKLLEEKSDARNDAYDDLVLADNLADDTVRNVFAKCEMYDRNHPGSNCLVKVFPGEKFGDIVRLSYAAEAVELENLATRLEGLGDSHELFPLGAEIRANAKRVNDAISARNDTIKAVSLATGEVNIAKEDLSRGYEGNYLEARKRYGRRNADKLFPKLNYQSTPEDKELDETDEPSNTAE